MWRIVSVLALYAASSTSSVLACGDKFVAFGHGVRLQRIYAAEHPAAILVYLPAGSPLAEPANRDRLSGLLRLAGHRPQVVSSVDEMKGAAATGEFDLILAQPADATAARDAAKSAAVIQLLWQPSREDLDRLDQRNECAAPVSKRNHELLFVINDVMEQRHKGVASVSCQRKRT